MSLAREKMTANRLYLAHTDMERAQNYLFAVTSLEERKDHTDDFHAQNAVDATFLAAVVVYARPFTKSRSRDRADPFIRSEAMDLIFHGAPELLRVHEKVMELRHMAAAHADWEYHGTRLIYDERSSKAFRSAWEPNFRETVDVIMFWGLIAHVNDWLVREFSGLDAGIVAQEGGADATIRRWRSAA